MKPVKLGIIGCGIAPTDCTGRLLKSCPISLKLYLSVVSRNKRHQIFQNDWRCPFRH
jgi:hypothetical protein